jgi:carbon storage regulator
MLVLGRKENQSIIIGQNIRVTIVGRSGSSIRIGVQAPSDVRSVREELVAGADMDEGTSSAKQPDWLLASLSPTKQPRKAAG